MKETKYLLSIKVNAKHLELETKIKEMDTSQDITRGAIINRAIQCADTVDDWKKVQTKLSSIKSNRANISNNTSMQTNLDETTKLIVDNIKKQIIEDLDLTVLQQQYFLQLVLMCYLMEISQHLSGVEETLHSELSVPDMFKLMAELMLSQRNEDKNVIEEIKRILIEWRNSDESVSI